ncbi:MAG: NUDIX hydrolase [Chloroflexi bacterium]|nr:NUDIX hydrolase [Chloroflexota bacterium]MDA1219478.1 NUDIX hydrolase [Chloroflexota bacterium]
MVRLPPDDNTAHSFPVSVKGVVLLDSKVALLQNPREEWELPGGKLELGEIPEQCVLREIYEELNLTVRVGPILDSWVYHIGEGVDVLIVTYGCYPASATQVTHSNEHRAAGLFSMEEVPALKMPAGYKRSINDWWGRLSSKSPVSEPPN